MNPLQMYSYYIIYTYKMYIQTGLRDTNTRFAFKSKTTRINVWTSFHIKTIHAVVENVKFSRAENPITK